MQAIAHTRKPRSAEKHYAVFDAGNVTTEMAVPYWAVSYAEKLVRDLVHLGGRMPSTFRFETRKRGRAEVIARSETYTLGPTGLVVSSDAEPGMASSDF